MKKTVKVNLMFLLAMVCSVLGGFLLVRGATVVLGIVCLIIGTIILILKWRYEFQEPGS